MASVSSVASTKPAASPRSSRCWISSCWRTVVSSAIYSHLTHAAPGSFAHPPDPGRYRAYPTNLLVKVNTSPSGPGVVFRKIRPILRGRARSFCGHWRGAGMVLLDSGATWTGVGALALSALLLALGIVLFARWRKAAALEIARIQAASGRTESLLAEMARALGDAREQGKQVSALGELGSTLDLDAALERALRAVSGLAEADAALIVLRHDGEEPITAVYGLSGEESSRDLIGVPPEAGHARAVKLNYFYSTDEAANDEFRLSGGLAVPLADEGGQRVGTLAVFWRRSDRAVAEDELERFE